MGQPGGAEEIAAGFTRLVHLLEDWALGQRLLGAQSGGGGGGGALGLRLEVKRFHPAGYAAAQTEAVAERLGGICGGAGAADGGLFAEIKVEV